MLSSKCLSRATLQTPHAPRLCRNIATRSPRPQVRTATHPYAQRRQQHFVRSVATVTVLWATATAWQWCSGHSIIGEVHAEEPPQEEEVVKFEAPRRQATSSDDNRNIISSQHLQVVKSWENPGVYAWGSNSGKAVAPDSDDKFIKTPRRIPFFDGKLLRDIKLDRSFGAAIDERGDLLQWGTAFSTDISEPTKTLKGQNLKSLTISRDRIIALSSSGAVYSIPVSRAEQQDGPKPATTSWIPFWSTDSNDVSYRIRTPENLGWNERVTQVSSGLEHALMLTSAGRVFSFASGTEAYPSKGQLGVPDLRWETRPAGPYDIPHEITTLRGFRIKKIATGDYHSLVCDSAGRAFTFGDNTSGQLGHPFNVEAQTVDAPSLLPTQRFGNNAKVANVFAGGNTSFLSVEATKPDTNRVIADTWAFGFGLTGQLGMGRWVHAQADPVKVPALSGLFEWDEANNTAIPIRLSTISVGATHAAAIMDNVASVAVSGRAQKLTDNDTNWGRDILFWGNNEFYQIGSGKRNNVPTPSYIQPLDQVAEQERAASAKGFGQQLREKDMHRFQITPRKKVTVNGRSVEFEQKIECGRSCTVVYSAV
ncbi:mitochondrial protein-like protein Fmp25 [Cucurbitaria berberidis CBS 394.84]|uniref:Mitochondrial protein-like protein Fmp25 n=1 Tax=Cucurbitaria berberidis CBS 394.84 TaxID=1168544 RepID=A0A9P4L6H7_9PLEO|nr:mitochondrial protein-like protein Fmp25 [Cucurbitaria berberidis CBS 394.84]KAF1843951.1 mitochondrial protein-like protein Fmp25 [Cucurbitaria berberidis CBS 394.84]